MSSRPEDLRIRNTSKIVKTLIINPNLSRVELARKLNLTKTTISSIINKLISLGIVEEIEKDNSGSIGKSPVPLRIKSDAATVIGIGLERKDTSGVLLNPDGKVLESIIIHESNRKKEDATKNLLKVIEIMLSKAHEHGIEPNAIGIGAPGPIDEKAGVIYSPSGLPDWENFNVAQIAQDAFNRKTYLINDADGGALAERFFGNGKELSSFVDIFFDEGIGCGIVLDGEIYRGAFGYSGEFDYLAFLGKSIGKGEDYFSLEKVLSELHIFLGKNQLQFGSSDIKEYLENSKNMEAKKKFEEIYTELGRIASIISNLIGPEAVIVSGRMIELGELFMKPFKDVFFKLQFGREKKVQLIKGAFPQNITYAIGAATNALLNHVIEKSIA